MSLFSTSLCSDERHSLDAVHPLVLLLDGGSRDAVERVIPLHHASVSLRLTRLDHLVLIIRDEELEAVLRSKHTQTITCLTTRRRHSVEDTVESVRIKLNSALFIMRLCIRTPLALYSLYKVIQDALLLAHCSMHMLLGCSFEFSQGKRSLANTSSTHQIRSNINCLQIIMKRL